MASWLGSILGIFLVDLVLSGDNAFVIGLTVSTLPRQQRMVAIIVGGSGAIVARVVFAMAATLLLQLRFLGIVGSIILLVIAIRLLVERSIERRSERSALSPLVRHLSNKKKLHIELPHTPMDRAVHKKRATNNLIVSIITILLADVTMSLDNVLAIGGLANGNMLPLIIGLVFSIIFLLLGSALIAEFIARLPWLLDLTCLIVAWTAAQIFLGDDSLNFTTFPWIPFVVPLVALIIVLITDIFFRIRDHQHALRL